MGTRVAARILVNVANYPRQHGLVERREIGVRVPYRVAKQVLVDGDGGVP